MNTKGLNIFNLLLVGLFAGSFQAFAGGAMVRPQTAPARPMGDTAAPNQCVNDYKAASELFKAALGEDAPIERVPYFKGTFTAGGMSFQTENWIVNSGDKVFLNTKLSLYGTETMISSPVKVCREGSKLTATLIMSSATMKNRLVDGPVQKFIPTVKNEIVINITRESGAPEVLFKSITFPDEPAARAAIK